ncbi:hypothetical protein LDENG_00274650 [Lucifuga dentata]|nr:hypothetical protein LDENG_00274650 [Lucifuga dentata]
MWKRQDCQFKILIAVLLLAAALDKIRGQVSSSKDGSMISQKTLNSDWALFIHSSTQDTESEVHPVTTVSLMNIPNYQHVLKNLLDEHLLTRNFEGDQHFREDGSVAAHPTTAGSVSAPHAGDSVTQLVPHEDAPAFSDIATTATVAATTPLTTFAPTTPRLPMSHPQKKPSMDNNKGAEQVDPTTDSLTTRMTQDNSGTASDNNLTASLSLQRSQPQRWSAVPVEGTLVSTSGRVEKSDAKETLKNKPSPGFPLHTLTSASQLEVNKDTTAPSKSITATTITAIKTADPCNLNFTDPEGNIEILQQVVSGVECNYLVTVYLGYGIEVQVLNVSVLDGEQVTVEDTGGRESSILANESVLMRGLVLRSWSNQISIRFHSDHQINSGFLMLHYQGELVSSYLCVSVCIFKLCISPTTPQQWTLNYVYT